MKNLSFIISLVLASVFNCYSQIEHLSNENIALVAKNIIEQLNVKQGNKLVLVNSPNKTVYFGLIGFFVKFGAKLQLLNLLIKIQLYY